MHGYKWPINCRGKGPQDLNTFVQNLGHRIVVYDGRPTAPFSALTLTPPVLATLGCHRGLPGERPGQFQYLHSVATDSQGSVYAAEVSFINIGPLFFLLICRLEKLLVPF